MDKPLISVVIPFYDTGSSLKKLLKKVLGLDFKGLEIICVDDCSTDDSYAQISTIKDNRIKLSRTEKNSGSAAARNLGLQKINGKYVCFLDSDDDIADNFFEKMLGAISDENTALGICGIRQKYLHTNPVKAIDKFTKPAIERKGNTSWKEYILSLMIADGRLYSSVNKIYRADIIRKHKLHFDESLDFAEDTKFVLDYLDCFDKDARIAIVPEALYIYNYGTPTSVVSTSSLKWENWQKNYEDILKWLGHEPSSSEAKLLKKLYQRFKISHALAVARSSANLKEKSKYLKIHWLAAATIVAKIQKIA